MRFSIKTIKFYPNMTSLRKNKRWMIPWTFLSCHKCTVYLTVWEDINDRAFTFWNSYGFKPFRKYLFINSCVFNISTQILKEWVCNSNPFIFLFMHYMYTERSLLKSNRKWMHECFLNYLKYKWSVISVTVMPMEKNVKPILQNTGINQILWKILLLIITLFPLLWRVLGWPFTNFAIRK